MAAHLPSGGEADKHSKKRGLGSRIGAGTGIILGGVAAVWTAEFVGGEISGVFTQLFRLSDLQATLVGYVIIQSLTILLLIGIANLVKANREVLGLGQIRNWNFFLLLPLFYLIALMSSVIVTALVSYFIPGFDIDQAQELGLADPSSQADLIMLGVLLVVLVPLAEEFIFRGYLFGTLRRELPFWATVIITSMIFGLAHGQWNVAIDTFVLSLILCFIREKSGSIWIGVGLHALKNFVAFLLLFVYNLA